MKPTLSKPTMDKAAAALLFSEQRKPSKGFTAPAGFKRLTVNIREDLHSKLKIAAVNQQCSATDIVERLLLRELS